MWLEHSRELKDQLARRLENEGDKKTAATLDECGVEIFLRCTECHNRTRGFTHCKKRYCPLCAPMLAAQRVAEHQAAVRAMKWPLHVTLTIRNTPDVTRAHLTALLKSFRRLRQRVLWKRTVRGGFAALEIVNTGNGWHPHLHIIADAEWISLRTAPPTRYMSREQKAERFREASAELGEEWADVIGQRTASVRVRRKHGGDEGARHLAVEAMKYSVKPADLVACEGRARDVIAAMKSVRLFRGFGAQHGAKCVDEEPREPCECEECGAHGTVMPEDIAERKVRFAARCG